MPTKANLAIFFDTGDVLGFSSALELIQFLFSPLFLGSLSLDQRNEFLLLGATLYDGIWKLRNQVHFENLPLSIDDLSSRIGRLLAEFKNSRFADMVFVRPTELLHAWSPPRRFSIKINVDAAIGLKFYVVVAVARVWRGRLVFACSQKVNTTFPLQFEAEAVKWALLLVAKLEAEGIYIETDSKICCDAIINPSQTFHWRIRSKVMEIQILLSALSNVFIN